VSKLPHLPGKQTARSAYQKRQHLKAAGTFAVFGKSAGLAGKDLQVFATDFVALSADMASFSNTTVDEAINAIGSALTWRG
jgi:hypothetical protein